ncbi:putative acyltransferase [Pelomonas saccharophila]|uniref:Acyltransferase n=1 Tax=Roseateles saccharophilus TaxID=304 RepID=A0ABU1YPD9_ROSSA|nr:heparan-alpha-glucosaminide N-acetyltransferase domain-containing protein [Roseateles saccharophilus]MDR7269846.1 putative acyltransferase [Roseateles saccharophilus]
MNPRILSLDAFRGFAIAAMLLVNNPGDWGHVYAPLLHAHWNGWTFTDWVFPFFVFISGMAMTLSLARRAQAGADKTALLLATSRRALVIIGIGLLLNLIPSFSFETLRIPGVLQRLGLCTLAAAPIVIWCDRRGVALWALLLMAIYSLVQLGMPVPDAEGVVHVGLLEPGKDAGAWLDRLLLDGHLWKTAKTWDPEGLLSTLPAVSTQLFGVLAGYVLASNRQPAEKTMTWVLAGLASLWLGQALDALLMPINKSLWTPSYAFAMSGWALLVFAVFYWLLDAMPQPLARERWARLLHPLVVFGMNALFLFALAGLVAKALYTIKFADGRTLGRALYAPLRDSGLAPINASLLHAIAFVLVMYAIAWFMHRKRWFVKV